MCNGILSIPTRSIEGGTGSEVSSRWLEGGSEGAQRSKPESSPVLCKLLLHITSHDMQLRSGANAVLRVFGNRQKPHQNILTSNAFPHVSKCDPTCFEMSEVELPVRGAAQRMAAFLVLAVVRASMNPLAILLEHASRLSFIQQLKPRGSAEVPAACPPQRRSREAGSRDDRKMNQNNTYLFAHS